jgi:hypothetical protein
VENAPSTLKVIIACDDEDDILGDEAKLLIFAKKSKVLLP